MQLGGQLRGQLGEQLRGKQKNKQLMTPSIFKYDLFSYIFQKCGPNFKSRKMAGSSKIINAHVGPGNSPISQ